MSRQVVLSHNKEFRFVNGSPEIRYRVMKPSLKRHLRAKINHKIVVHREQWHEFLDKLATLKDKNDSRVNQSLNIGSRRGLLNVFDDIESDNATSKFKRMTTAGFD